MTSRVELLWHRFGTQVIWTAVRLAQIALVVISFVGVVVMSWPVEQAYNRSSFAPVAENAGLIATISALLLVLGTTGWLLERLLERRKTRERQREAYKVFSAQVDSFIEERQAVATEGHKQLFSSANPDGQMGGTALKASGEFILLLRPFLWDDSLADYFAARLDARGVSWFLMEHKNPEALLFRLSTASGSGWGDLYLIASSTPPSKSFLEIAYASDIQVSITEFLGLCISDPISIIGLGDPRHSDNQLGMAFELSKEQDWRDSALDLMRRAQRIIVFPWDSPACKWEIKTILEHQALWRKTAIVVPGTGDVYGPYSTQWPPVPASIAPRCKDIAELLGVIDSVLSELGVGLVHKEAPLMDGTSLRWGGMYGLERNATGSYANLICGFGDTLALQTFNRWVSVELDRAVSESGL